MANIKSALKRIDITKKQTLKNKSRKSELTIIPLLVSVYAFSWTFSPPLTTSTISNPNFLAKSNGELVERVVRMAKELGREIATPDEARQILSLKK